MCVVDIVEANGKAVKMLNEIVVFSEEDIP
jgi:hypothetical protein